MQIAQIRGHSQIKKSVFFQKKVKVEYMPHYRTSLDSLSGIFGPLSQTNVKNKHSKGM